MTLSGVDRRNRALMGMYAQHLRQGRVVQSFIEVLRQSLAVQQGQLRELLEEIRDTDDLDQRRALLQQAVALEDSIEQQLVGIEEMTDAIG